MVVQTVVQRRHRFAAAGYGLWQRLIVLFRKDGSFLSLTLILRAAFLLDVISRPLLRTGDDAPRHLDFWWPAVAGYTIYLVVLTIMLFAVRRETSVFTSDCSKLSQIILDTGFFGLFYILNGNPESNLVLTFWLPLIAATRYFSIRMVALVFFIVVTVIGGNILWLQQSPPPLASAHPLWRIFILRSLLFLCITWPLVRAERLYRRLKEQTENYRDQVNKLVCSVRDAQRQPLDQLLPTTLEAVRREIHADHVALFLYDNGVFRRHAGANIPDDWFSEEQYAAGEGITGKVVVGTAGTLFGQPVRVNDVSGHPDVHREHLVRYASRLKSGLVAHLLAVPLDGANRTFGVLRAINKLRTDGSLDPTGFTERDQDILSSSAMLLSLAYAARRREERVTSVLRIADAATQTSDESTICAQIATLGVKMGYAVCAVRVSEQANQLRLVGIHSAADLPVRLFEKIEPLPAELYSVLRDQRDRVMADLASDPRPEVAEWSQRTGLRSAIILPLQGRQQTVGVLEIYTTAPHCFFDNEREMLRTFAAKATLALDSAHLVEQHSDQIRRLRSLADIISTITSSTSHEMLFDRVVHRVATLLNAEDCSIFWVNTEQQTLDLKASHRVPQALFTRRMARISAESRSGLPSFVAATGKPLQFIGDEYKTHPAWNGEFREHLAYLPSKACLSLMMYPIIDSTGRVRGVIRVENKSGSEWQRGFTATDRELLDLLTKQVAIAIDKIDQVARLQHLEHLVEPAVGARDADGPRFDDPGAIGSRLILRDEEGPDRVALEARRRRERDQLVRAEAVTAGDAGQERPGILGHERMIARRPRYGRGVPLPAGRRAIAETTATHAPATLTAVTSASATRTSTRAGRRTSSRPASA
ncbi:MAG TPA: GAF domain-containing protein, partial [Roseiflexaceae bacterium]